MVRMANNINKTPKKTPNLAEQQQPIGISNKLIFVLIIILILLSGLLSVIYIAYQNTPGSPVKLNPVVMEAPVITNQTYEEVRQFYPNMKFNHNEISYNIDSACHDKKRQRMREAFDLFAGYVDNLNFFETSGRDVDIEITCSEQRNEVEGKYFIAGEGGAREIIPTGRYNVITNGTVILYGNPHGFLECDWANVELHELVHVFGFGHSKNPDSLMYHLLESCDQQLDDSIIEELQGLYLEENLADLYFEDAKALKKRKFLDFNLTVKNSGSVDAENVKLEVFDEEELIQTFELGDDDGKIKYGAGIIVNLENLKLAHSNPSEIRFVVNYKNDEIDKENNIAKIIF